MFNQLVVRCFWCLCKVQMTNSCWVIYCRNICFLGYNLYEIKIQNPDSVCQVQNWYEALIKCMWRCAIACVTENRAHQQNKLSLPIYELDKRRAQEPSSRSLFLFSSYGWDNLYCTPPSVPSPTMVASSPLTNFPGLVCTENNISNKQLSPHAISF